MAVDGAGVSPALAIRSSVGIELWASSGPKLPYEHKSNFPREETKNCRSISFSPDGRFFAFSNGQVIKVLQSTDWQVRCTLPRPKAFYLKFSPRGNYICSWELYTVTKDKPEGSPNMFVYELATGAEVFATIQKKQTDWEPSWSNDESIFAIVVGGEALFYDVGDGAAGFERTTRKIGGSRGALLMLGPGNSPPYLAFYTPGAKDGPAMCKLYKYPAIAQNQVVACKSFFQSDRVEMLWNKRGSGLLLLTSTEVDKSGASYYGNQALHFMNTKSETCSVPLAKEGPVHCVKWSPNATEFVVVYGFMPSKAALYNLKCDVTFDFGEGPRNCAYFNAFGTIVVLAGFGNLPGNVEIWDVKKKEKLANIKCPDTTQFEWSPNGEYFVTATTAPRLRISNGFKVYHYSGALMHETLWPTGQELLEVTWQQFPLGTFPEPVITKTKQEGIKSSQPEASKKAYTPPHLRLMKEGKNPEKYLPQPQAATAGPHAGSSAHAGGKKGGQKTNHHNNSNNNTNSAGNNNQKYNKFRNKKEPHAAVAVATTDADGAAAAAMTGAEGGAENVSKNEMNAGEQKYTQSLPTHRHKQQKKQQHQQQSPQVAATTTAAAGAALAQVNGGTEETHTQKLDTKELKKPTNPEKEKKIRNVAKKLSDIKKLKARQDQGEALELNQLNKISMESKFLEELKVLKTSA